MIEKYDYHGFEYEWMGFTLDVYFKLKGNVPTLHHVCINDRDFMDILDPSLLDAIERHIIFSDVMDSIRMDLKSDQDEEIHLENKRGLFND